ncbi:unnamed protein product, partial [Polarella glacialis]
MASGKAVPPDWSPQAAVDFQQELLSQQEQLRQVSISVDRQVARLSRELERVREHQEREPVGSSLSRQDEVHWRLREDVDALSRRVDGLEALQVRGFAEADSLSGKRVGSPGTAEA